MESSPTPAHLAEPSAHSSRPNRQRFFLLVFLMLCGLTGLSFWIANSHLMQNPATGWAAMIAVSCAKALLVMLFFMHLWWERIWKYAITLPALILGTVLVLLLIPDIGFRTESWSNTRQIAAPIPVVPESNQTNGPPRLSRE